MKHRGQPTRSMAFVSGAFAPCSFSSSSRAIFDEYDTEEEDDEEEQENAGHSPDDDEENTGDVGLLGTFNSDAGLFLLHMFLNLFQPN